MSSSQFARLCFAVLSFDSSSASASGIGYESMTLAYGGAMSVPGVYPCGVGWGNWWDKAYVHQRRWIEGLEGRGCQCL